MAKCLNHKQKSRLLYLKEIFEMETDKDNYITGKKIMDELEEEGIVIERKTLYDDIACLQEYGMDIEKASNKKGWHLRSREFEDSDLRFLADAVQLSKFLGERKTTELVNKILGFGSDFIGENIKKQLNIEDRIKRSNETAHSNLASIQQGISEKTKIKFLYYKHDVEGKFKPKENRDKYVVSPLHLVYADDYYYLIAWSEKDKEIRNYRIDRMRKILLTDEPAISNDETKSFKINNFIKTAFSMYSGKKVKLTLEVKESAMDALIDRFGKNVKLKTPSKYAKGAANADEEPVAYAIVEVMESPTFYGWLSQFPQKIKIVKPEDSQRNYLNHLDNILSGYK